MEKYLAETEIINFSNEDVYNLARELAKGCKSAEAVAKNCFVYVRDEIRHSGDYKENITTCKASEVLEHKTGWCYTEFSPPLEKLAFEPQENEYDMKELYSNPLPEVTEALQRNSCYSEMVNNFPDIVDEA